MGSLSVADIKLMAELRIEDRRLGIPERLQGLMRRVSVTRIPPRSVPFIARDAFNFEGCGDDEGGSHRPGNICEGGFMFTKYYLADNIRVGIVDHESTEETVLEGFELLRRAPCSDMMRYFGFLNIHPVSASLATVHYAMKMVERESQHVACPLLPFSRTRKPGVWGRSDDGESNNLFMVPDLNDRRRPVLVCHVAAGWCVRSFDTMARYPDGPSFSEGTRVFVERAMNHRELRKTRSWVKKSRRLAAVAAPTSQCQTSMSLS